MRDKTLRWGGGVGGSFFISRCEVDLFHSSASARRELPHGGISHAFFSFPCDRDTTMACTLRARYSGKLSLDLIIWEVHNVVNPHNQPLPWVILHHGLSTPSILILPYTFFIEYERRQMGWIPSEKQAGWWLRRFSTCVEDRRSSAADVTLD